MSSISRRVWKQVPLFRAIWPFIGGIILGIFVPDRLLSAGAIGIAFVLLIPSLIMLNRQGGRLWSNLPLGAVFALGYALTVFHTDRLYDDHVSDLRTAGDGFFIARIISDPIPRDRSVKTEVEVTHFVEAGDTLSAHGKVLLYFQPDEASSTLAFGDEVAFQARLNNIPPPQNPNEFNYQRYMHFHQVSNQVYLESDAWKLIKQGEGFRRQVFAWQHQVIEIIRSFEINDRELAILSALMVGYKHYLSSDQVNAFASAGAMHVLAVSGLHVGIIYLIIQSFLKVLDRKRWGRLVKGILMIGFLWFYALLTGLSPSVTRAATMFTFVIVATQFRRHTDIYNTLASSAFALLIYNPFLVVEVGFQLSYLAVLGIVLLQPRIYALWQPKWWLLDKMWAITAVSLAAQAATFPLGLLYFHQFPNYFLLSNLVVIPAATVILPVGIALVVFHWIPWLSDALAWVLYQMVHWLDVFIQWVEQLPMALLLGIDISIFETYLIYMVIASLCAFLITRRYQWLMTLLATFIAVEVMNISELMQQKEQKLWVVYNVKKQDAMDFIEGTEHTFIADSVLTNDFDKMRFHIHHHWWNRDLQDPSAEIVGLHRQGDWILFDSLRILTMDSGASLPSMDGQDVHVLYLKHRTQNHPKEVIAKVNPQKVVLSSGMDWKSHRYWLKLCSEMGIPVHSLREHGAFVVDLNE